MRHLFAGALALSLLAAGAASAQTDQPRPGGYQQQQYNRDLPSGDQMGDHRYGMDRDGYRRYRHGRGGRWCHWRHHHRVCHPNH